MYSYIEYSAFDILNHNCIVICDLLPNLDLIVPTQSIENVILWNICLVNITSMKVKLGMYPPILMWHRGNPVLVWGLQSNLTNGHIDRKQLSKIRHKRFVLLWIKAIIPIQENRSTYQWSLRYQMFCEW